MSDKKEVAVSEAQQMKQDLEQIKIGPRGFEIQTVAELVAMLKVAMQSRIVPTDCRSLPEALIRAEHGMSVGLSPMRALQSVYVVNNRPCLWGSAVAGLVQSSGKCKLWQIESAGDGDKAVARLTTERNDIGGVNVFEYSMADAKAGNLLSKGPWTNHPKDMLRAKVIARAAKSVYGDVISGMGIVEDEQDAIDVNASVTVEAATVSRLDAMAADMESQLPQEAIVIDDGAPDLFPDPGNAFVDQG